MPSVDIVRVKWSDKRREDGHKKKKQHYDGPGHGKAVPPEAVPENSSKTGLSHNYLVLILGSAIMYPISARRFPRRVKIAPIVRIPMTVG